MCVCIYRCISGLVCGRHNVVLTLFTTIAMETVPFPPVQLDDASLNSDRNSALFVVLVERITLAGELITQLVPEIRNDAMSVNGVKGVHTTPLLELGCVVP